MSTLLDRVKAVFRYRTGKYDADNNNFAYPITKAGATINETSALAISTVYACVYKISSTIAALGLEVYEKEGDSVVQANVHPVYNLIKVKPNDHQTAFEFWETLLASAIMYGVGYAVIQRDQRGIAIELIPVHYSDVDLRSVKGERVYIVKDLGAVRPENMLEICNLLRMSPIRLHPGIMEQRKLARN